MSAATAIKGAERTEVIKAWNGQIDVRVRIAGRGPAVVYFHPAAGLYWDQFLDHLAGSFTVYAPEMPGTSIGDPYAIHKVDSFRDLLLIYEETLRKLGLNRPVAIGQSMGGMVTCDLAAHFPALFSRIVALDPVGLWREDIGGALAEVYTGPPDKLPNLLFRDPGHPQAQAMFTLPEDPDVRAKVIAGLVWSLGCSGKFLWPFADHGLANRLHRIDVPALIVWGREDALVPVAYAQEFVSRLPRGQVAIIENSGHIPQMEQMEETLKIVGPFVAAATS